MMAAIKKQQFALDTIERIKRHRGICAIYNLEEDEKKSLLAKLGDEFLISGLKCSRKTNMVMAFGKDLGMHSSERVETKIVKFMTAQDKNQRAIIVDSAEMVSPSGLDFLLELNDKYQQPVVLVSSHPRYMYLLHDSKIYRNKALAEVDYKVSL
jgi:DNA transposition AAA+ family ATPase